MEVLKFNNSHADQWDNVVKKSKNGIFLFYRNYLDYHKDRFVDHSLMISKNNKVIALFPANEKENEIFSHGGLTFGSLIMDYDIRANEVLEIFEKIRNYYKDRGYTRIIYKAIPPIYHKYFAEEDLYALFRLGAKLFRRDISSVIKIKSKIKFSESKRQAVTKCEKKNIQVVEGSDLEEYWELLTEVLSKFNTTPVHSLEEINNLKSLFPDNIRLFEARKDNLLLAGIIIYDFGNVIHTQYMANSQEGRKIGALDFINHTLINDVFNDKEYYSFGISTENQGYILNEGLIQQKEMMGARGITIDFYSINL